ncbi:hypothetical protein EUBSIR_02095 [[Eubacterium] siraeum DSM 15702]|uniref:Uncharacterized protein n=1 Tax=[Eubacterium] siraeum DSM 15702 TaxID=428128 RepID=B0MQH9_9FIRM|nr:hypothetical protein EUBSIR_02095 [[Eubacterium] siraeum DSM 15702]
MGGYFFLFEELIVNIITVNAVRKIPICVKSLKVMYISYTPFQMFSHLGRCIDRLSSKEPSSLLYISSEINRCAEAWRLCFIAKRS